MLIGNIEYGVGTRVTVTGTLSIGSSAGNAALLGILVGSVGTAPTVNAWQGQVTGGSTIIGSVTLAANAFTRIPAYCAGGATFYISGIATPDLTIYWNPIA